MAAHQKGKPGYSLPNAKRKSPLLTVTMPRDLQERLRAEAERRGVTVARAVAEATIVWLALPGDEIAAHVEAEKRATIGHVAAREIPPRP